MSDDNKNKIENSNSSEQDDRIIAGIEAKLAEQQSDTSALPESEDFASEPEKEKKRDSHGEWILLLLSIILLFLLLFIFGRIGISYYKLQKNSVFKIYDNVVILGPGGLYSGEGSELGMDGQLIIGTRPQGGYYPGAYPEDTAAQETQQSGDEGGRGGSHGGGRGGSHGGGGQNHPSGPTGHASSFIVRDENGYEYSLDENGTLRNTKNGEEVSGSEFLFDWFDGVIYPGDEVPKVYEAEITYTGRVGLNINIPQGSINEEKDSIAAQLGCEVYVKEAPDAPYERIYPGSGDEPGPFKGMNVTYPLAQAGSETMVTVPVKIVVSVPKDFNENYTKAGDGRFQGKKITDFTVKWGIDDNLN